MRLSGSIDEAAAAAFLSQVLPVLDVPGSIVLELFSPGGDAEVGRRLAREVRLLRQAHGRDMWFLGKTLVASDKLMRFGPFSSQCRAGNVEILRGPWKADLFRVLEGFPELAHDDEVDTCSGPWKCSIPTCTQRQSGC